MSETPAQTVTTVTGNAPEPDQLLAAPSCVVDSMSPRTVLTPANETELGEVLRDANDAGHAVIAIGRGAHLSLGNVPERYDIALSTQHIDAIVAHDPEDMTVTVQAGVELSMLQRALAAHGQFLPIDPPGHGQATIGGVLAANAQGPLRASHGTGRDWVIGMRVIMADGQAVSSGGRVVKNVTGYDMHKLHIGAIGTLAVIAEVTFKLAPLPRAEHTIAMRFPSATAAGETLGAAARAGLAIAAAELLSPASAANLYGTPGWMVLARIAGGHAAVGRSLRDLQALCEAQEGAPVTEEAPEGAWERWSELFAPVGVALRVSVAPAVLGGAVSELHSSLVASGGALSATMPAGLIRVSLPPDPLLASTLDAVDAVARRHGGSMFIDAAPIEIKRARDVFGPPRSDLAIMRRIKQEYDPKRTLSPGRFYGRI